MAVNNSDTEKIMDVAKPGTLKPDSTSRPLVVTDRSLITEDPMIARSAEIAAAGGSRPQLTAPAPSPSVKHTQITIKPAATRRSVDLSEPDAAETEAVKPEAVAATSPSATRKVIAPLSDAEKSAEIDKVPPKEPPVEETVKPETEPTDTKTKPAEIEEDKPVKEEPKATEESKPEETAEEAIEITEDGGEEDKEDSHDASETHSKRGDELRISELNSIIASRKYAVPIGATKHRRQRTIFALLFLVLLAVFAVNLLLDMGIVEIEGIPHTSFFRKIGESE